MSCPRVWAGVDLAGKKAGVKSLNVGKGVSGPSLALRSHFWFPPGGEGFPSVFPQPLLSLGRQWLCSITWWSMWCQVRAMACPGLGSPLSLLASFPYPPHPLLPSTGAFSHPPSPIFPASPPSPPSSGPSSFSSHLLSPLSPLSLSFVTLSVCGAGLGFPAGLFMRKWLLSPPRAYALSLDTCCPTPGLRSLQRYQPQPQPACPGATLDPVLEQMSGQSEGRAHRSHGETGRVVGWEGLWLQFCLHGCLVTILPPELRQLFVLFGPRLQLP